MTKERGQGCDAGHIRVTICIENQFVQGFVA